MTWTNRLRLYGGMLAVLALVGVLVIVFNQRQSQALSVTGHIAADEATVGAAYGGVVVNQNVQDGQTVRQGQPLFTIASPSVRMAATQGAPAVSTAAYSVNTHASSVTYKALTAGEVTDVQVSEGSFVQSGSTLATIVAAHSQFAVAEFVLSPNDYERIQHGARVELLLPNNQSVTGSVKDVSVTTSGTQARTKVVVTSPALRSPSLARLTQPGTPVSATLDLRNNGILAGPSDMFFGFLRKIGLK